MSTRLVPASVLLLLALSACGPSSRGAEVVGGPPTSAPAAPPAAPRPPPSRPALAGSWSETWGVEGESDVGYHDVYEIGGTGSKLVVSCPARPYYQFRKVELQGARLVVELENDGLVIHYDLTLDPAGEKLVGRATTSAGTDVSIVWDRVRKGAQDR